MKFVEMPTELQTKSIETLSLNYGMPEEVIDKWKDDYIQMCNSMMYGKYPSFDEVIADIRALNSRLKEALK